MKELKTKKYKGSLILKLAIMASLVFVAVTLINQQLQIHEKKAALSVLDAQVKVQEIKNKEIQYSIDEGIKGDAKYAEEYARSELDYAKQGERVYVNVGGN